MVSKYTHTKNIEKKILQKNENKSKTTHQEYNYTRGNKNI